MTYKPHIAVILLAICSSAIAAETSGVELLTPEVLAQRAARQIYIGSERDMPLNGQYRFAIQLRLGPSGEVLIPNSILDALNEMRRALPNWYVAALKASSGNTECMVVVNNVPYGSMVASWMWLNWVKPGSPLWNEFEALGARVRNSLTIQNALSIGLCDLIKTDDERVAMEQLAFQGKFELVQ